MNTRVLQSVGIGCGAAVLAIALWSAGALDRLESSTWAWRVACFAPHRAPSPQVKVVLLDQSSLDWGKTTMNWSWPWPREVYAPLLDFCRRGGARVVAFDILFTEPSLYGVADDEALGAAIRRTPRFVGAAFYGRNGATLPIPSVATNAAALANVGDDPDPDGVFRRATLVRSAGGTHVFSLGMAAWQLGAGDAPRRPVSDLPLDRSNRLLLNFAGREGRHETYGAAALIQSEQKLQSGEAPLIDPAVFSNAYVLVGFGAPGLMDVRPTPISRISPGVEVHATVIDNLLTGRVLRDAPRLAVVLCMLALGWASAGLVLWTRHARQSALAFLICLPLPVGMAFAGYGFDVWWPLVVGVLTVALALVGATLWNYATEGRQKAFIRNAFRHYLGDEVIEQILSDPSRLKLGGEKRELTVFFSDIEKFSTFSERLEPEALTALLNDYLSDMGKIIQEEGGYLDKYIGDAIVAFWNAPVAQPDHAARACRAALKCQRKLAERREEFERRTGVVLRARIGLNTGEAVVGNMGSHERFNYTVLGDAANLASRLEGANKAFGTYLMVSENTWRAAGAGWVGRELARLRVVGRKAPVRVYELSGMPGEPRPEAWDDFDAARELFGAGRLAEAAERFERCGGDAAAHAYAERCRSLLARPGEAADGVWALTEK